MGLDGWRVWVGLVLVLGVGRHKSCTQAAALHARHLGSARHRICKGISVYAKISALCWGREGQGQVAVRARGRGVVSANGEYGDSRAETAWGLRGMACMDGWRGVDKVAQCTATYALLLLEAGWGERGGPETTGGPATTVWEGGNTAGHLKKM